MFYNNYKWNMTFALCESLYCAPVTYNIVYHLYFNLKKKKKRSTFSFLGSVPSATQVGKVNGRLFFALFIYELSIPTQKSFTV